MVLDSGNRCNLFNLSKMKVTSIGVCQFNSRMLDWSALESLDTTEEVCGAAAAAVLISPTLVEQTFGGKAITTSACGKCGHKSEHGDNFRELTLSFPTNPGKELTVLNLLEYYLQPELLTGDNQYFCGRCNNLTDSEKTTKVVETPAHLIITLKRFQYDVASHRRTKIMDVVLLDDNVVLNEFYFKLNAVIIHSGSTMDSGHYYTIGRDELDWYKFNDETVSVSSLKNLGNLGYHETPYILFYTREDIMEFQNVSPDAIASRLQDVVGITNSETDQGNKTKDEDTEMDIDQGKKTKDEDTEIDLDQGKKTKDEDTEMDIDQGKKTKDEDTVIDLYQGKKTKDEDTEIDLDQGKKTKDEDTEMGLDMEEQSMSNDVINQCIKMLPLAESEFSTTVDNLDKI